jgi:tetratricopeptide (TPR) repeat protein
MYRMMLPLSLLVLAAAGAGLHAEDTLKLTAEKQPVRGVVGEMSPTEVTLKQGPLDKKYPVNEIEWIAYENEATQMTSARRFVLSGKYQEGLASLAKLTADDVKRPELKQDAAYFKAIATARLALAGSASVSEAGKMLLEFEKLYPRSYHYLSVCEAVGDLFASVGKYDQAGVYYAKLAAAPWPAYQMKADVALGRALLGRKDYAGAIAKFESAQKQTVTGPEADSLRLAAALGKASAVAGQGKQDEAVKAIEEVIAKADAEDGELHARAYNALGSALLASGKKKDALLAYLHVDLLFSSYPEQHAEALANLAILWKEVDKADRANQAAAALRQQYPSSRWVKK